MKCASCSNNLTSRLRHKIVIQQLARTPDGAGGWTESWATYANVFAGVEPLRGKEMFEHQQIQSEITHRIRIRYLAGITPEKRVSFRGRVFRILSVLNINEANREMQLMCQEVADPR